MRAAAEQYACLTLGFPWFFRVFFLFISSVVAPSLPCEPFFCRYKTARANLFSIISTFRRSDPLMRVFREKAEELLPNDCKFLELMEPVPTRWVYEYAFGSAFA